MPKNLIQMIEKRNLRIWCMLSTVKPRSKEPQSKEKPRSKEDFEKT